MAGIVGGATSSALGGDFAAGAFSASFARLFNDEKKGHGLNEDAEELRTYYDNKPTGRSDFRASEWEWRKVIATDDVPNVKDAVGKGAGKLSKTLGEYAEYVGIELQEGTRSIQQYLEYERYSYQVYVDSNTYEPTTERFNITPVENYWKGAGAIKTEKTYRICTGKSTICSR